MCSSVGGTVARPRHWLAGFAAVDAAPGQETTVTVPVRRRAFEHWDVAEGRWAVEPGTFRLEIGSSSGDLPLAAEVIAE